MRNLMSEIFENFEFVKTQQQIKFDQEDFVQEGHIDIEEDHENNDRNSEIEKSQDQFK